MKEFDFYALMAAIYIAPHVQTIPAAILSLVAALLALRAWWRGE